MQVATMADRGTRMQLRRSVHQCIEDYPYTPASTAQSNLQASCKNSLSFVRRLGLLHNLFVHNGCVNTVNWNASGSHIVSGSDDNHLVITEAKSGRVLLRSKTQHKRHIFSARFMPLSGDRAVVSCSGEGLVLHTEFLAPYHSNKTAALVGESERVASVFDCHKFGSAFDVLPLPDTARGFLSCGEDATVRSFDLRQTSSCSERVCHKHILVMAPCAVTAMDVAPISHHTMAIGCSDSIVRLYDRRMLSGERTPPVKAYPIPLEYTRRHYRPTCVKFSADEGELLVSYSMEQLYLFDLKHAGYSDADLLKSGCYTSKMRRDDDPEPQMPRLRFRGDWSDTGPNSVAVAEQSLNRTNVGQARPALEPGVLSRLSDEIFRMLNSPSRQMRQPPGPAAASDSGSTSDSAPAAAESPPPAEATAPRSRPTWHSAMIRALENEAGQASRREETSPSEGADSEQPGNSCSPAETVEEETTCSEESEPGQSSAEAPQFPIRSFDYVKMSFSGHRNSRTMVKGACFWGDDFIMSGSDCGHIFVWQRQTGKVVKTLLADNRVVNRVQPHPTLPYLLSSGIDYNVKLWAPIAAEPHFDEAECEGLMKSNEIMLVETRDTITVPAQIMIRILASLHQYRRLMHAARDAAESTADPGAAGGEGDGDGDGDQAPNNSEDNDAAEAAVAVADADDVAEGGNNDAELI
ncbi:hypothetical protein KR009_009320 [Drosophila setifemur]|nr:hypothetical protein KR009_009320 [Drosophila setifemur]